MFRDICVYVARYMGTILCMSESKKSIKKYCRDRRNLSREEYTIGYLYLSDSEFNYCRERPEFLEYCHGVILPAIDCAIINEDFEKFTGDLIESQDITLNTLRLLDKSIQPQDRKQLIHSCNLLGDIIEECDKFRGYSDYECDFYKHHEIHKMSIIHYLSYRNTRQEFHDEIQVIREINKSIN